MMRGAKPHLVIDNDAVAGELPAPGWLSEDARTEWNRVAPILVERRILTDADLGSLENYCVCIGQVRECQRILNEKGMTSSNARGTRKRPEVSIQADAMTRARLLAAELGLTPVSRSRPSIRDDDDVDSLVD